MPGSHVILWVGQNKSLQALLCVPAPLPLAMLGRPVAFDQGKTCVMRAVTQGVGSDPSPSFVRTPSACLPAQLVHLGFEPGDT